MNKIAFKKKEREKNESSNIQLMDKTVWSNNFLYQ